MQASHLRGSAPTLHQVDSLARRSPLQGQREWVPRAIGIYSLEGERFWGALEKCRRGGGLGALVSCGQAWSWRGRLPRRVPSSAALFSGPVLLLTSDNIKQRLGSAALDRYAGPQRARCRGLSTAGASPQSARAPWVSPLVCAPPWLRPLDCAPCSCAPVCAPQHPRVPAVQLAGAAGGHPPHRALPGGQHPHALDPALHPAGRLHPHRGPGRAGAHSGRGGRGCG